MVSDKLPPHNIEAEQSVLGALLLDDRSIGDISPILKKSDFYREAHAFIYEAMLRLHERGEPTDQISVAQELTAQKQLTNVGGHKYLTYLITITPTSTHVRHYATIVHRTSILRQLITAAEDIATIGHEGGSDTEDAIRLSEDILYALRSKSTSRNFVPIKEPLDTYLNKAPLKAGGILTNFKPLDSLIGGLHKSDMIVVAARPSIGKSMLALHMALNVALQGKKVAIFSLEMGVEQVAARMLACQSTVNLYKIRTRRTTDEEDQRMIDAVGVLSDLDIYIDDTPIQSVPMMMSKARQLSLGGGLDFVVIDYMQLIEGSTSANRFNRVQEVSEISRHIKGMARDLDIPVLAISQLSRAVEHRDEQRPILSDLRESGSIEQDADIVMFIYRADKHIKKEDWIKKYPNQDYPQGLAELIVAKHRNGPTDKLTLSVRDEFSRFDHGKPVYGTKKQSMSHAVHR